MTPLNHREIVSLRLDLTALEARVLFHLLSEGLSNAQLHHVLPHANERQAAQAVYQRIRTLAYGDKAVRA